MSDTNIKDDIAKVESEIKENKRHLKGCATNIIYHGKKLHFARLQVAYYEQMQAMLHKKKELLEHIQSNITINDEQMESQEQCKDESVFDSTFFVSPDSHILCVDSYTVKEEGLDNKNSKYPFEKYAIVKMRCPRCEYKVEFNTENLNTILKSSYPCPNCIESVMNAHSKAKFEFEKTLYRLKSKKFD